MHTTRTMHSATVTHLRPQVQRGKVVCDGWNMLRGADSVLAHGDSMDRLYVDVGRLANRVGAVSRATTGEFLCVDEISIHVGVSDPARHPQRHAYEMDMIRQWQRDSRVTVHIHRNEYDEAEGTYGEKSVDEAIGKDLLDSQASGRFDLVVLFSEDSDHERDLATAFGRFRETQCKVALAKWEGQKGLSLLPGKRIGCHYLNRRDLDLCSTPRRYGDVA